jgi:hypothetical protein
MLTQKGKIALILSSETGIHSKMLHECRVCGPPLAPLDSIVEIIDLVAVIVIMIVIRRISICVSLEQRCHQRLEISYQY